MLALERRNQILEKLQEEKKVVVSELSQHYGVSEETIRRDLEKMHKEGLCIKSYGGAIINENNNTDMPFNIRSKSNVIGKQRIAELIASLVNDGEHIMLDASSTAVFVSKALKSKERLTVVTNSIEILIQLSDVSDWNIISSGGQIKEGYLALVGPRSIETIQSYNVEKAIISCKAFDLEKGFSDSNEDFARAKQAMLRGAKECILAVDSTKLKRFAFAKVGDLRDIDVIVTDKKPESETLERFQAENIKCLYP